MTTRTTEMYSEDLKPIINAGPRRLGKKVGESSICRTLYGNSFTKLAGKAEAGSTPRKAAKRRPVGERFERNVAICCGKPRLTAIEYMCDGMLVAKTVIVIVKNKAMLIAEPMLLKVCLIPLPTPLSLNLNEFNIAVVFGAENNPFPIPFMKSMISNGSRLKLYGSSVRA